MTMDGLTEWNISCTEDGVYTAGSATECSIAPNCGLPRVDPLASSLKADVYFPEIATYNCSRGTTLDGIANGAKTYDLECQEDGTFKDASKKCEKVRCGEPPQYVGASRSAGVRFAFDQVRYQCDERHMTTDGLTEWNVSCGEDGIYTRGSATNCSVAPNCGSPRDDPLASFSRDDVYFQEKATYTCSRGSTLEGIANGATSYDLECQKDGTFKHAIKKCEKVRCGEPPQYAGASRADGVRFAFDQVHYKCNERHTTTDGLTEWNISCTVDGIYTPGSATECSAVPSCGSPPSHPFATSPTEDVFFPDTVTYTCNDGYRLQGKEDGAATYQLECQSDGRFKSDNSKCRAIIGERGSWTVEGSVKDATNTRTIAGARIRVAMSTGSSVDVVTDGNGKYSVGNVPSGVTTFSVEADGFVTVENELVVTSDVAGRGGDFFLSPHAQSAGDWRAVLRWGAHPTDLDAHLLFSNDLGCHVSFRKVGVVCEGATATLDVDDRNGFGPETISVKNADDTSSTLLYRVHWYSDEGRPSKPLQESEAQVDIYRGDELISKMEINFHGYIAPDNVWWHVARLNPSTGRVSACTNAQCD
jgi:uncharacterized protein YfaP (DUF2135 family)